MTRTPQWDATGRRVLKGDGVWQGLTGQRIAGTSREVVTIGSDAAAAERVRRDG